MAISLLTGAIPLPIIVAGIGLVATAIKCAPPGSDEPTVVPPVPEAPSRYVSCNDQPLIKRLLQLPTWAGTSAYGTIHPSSPQCVDLKKNWSATTKYPSNNNPDDTLCYNHLPPENWVLYRLSLYTEGNTEPWMQRILNPYFSNPTNLTAVYKSFLQPTSSNIYGILFALSYDPNNKSITLRFHDAHLSRNSGFWVPRVEWRGLYTSDNFRPVAVRYEEETNTLFVITQDVKGGEIETRIASYSLEMKLDGSYPVGSLFQQKGAPKDVDASCVSTPGQFFFNSETKY